MLALALLLLAVALLVLDGTLSAEHLPYQPACRNFTAVPDSPMPALTAQPPPSVPCPPHAAAACSTSPKARQLDFAILDRSGGAGEEGGWRLGR